MQQQQKQLFVFFVLASFSGTIIREIEGHAIFWEPPSRASLGKHSDNYCHVPINDDHMSLYCGGITLQHDTNHGKCGICGDPYNAAVHPHQVVGIYATGIVTRSYVPGQLIDVLIDVVANHRGFFAFKLCVNNNPDKDPEPECFDQHRLNFENGSNLYFVPPTPPPLLRHPLFRASLKLKLPDGLTCWQCILQWTWVAANNWGVGPQMADYWTEDCVRDKEGKVGCGHQETFRGCADICIGHGCPTGYCQKARPFTTDPGLPPVVAPTSTPTVVPPPTAPGVIPAPTAPTPPTPPSPPLLPDQVCIETGIKTTFASPQGDRYCKETCLGQPMKYCNLYICYCNTKFHTGAPAAAATSQHDKDVK